MRLRSSAPLLGALALLSLVASSGCINDTWIEITLRLRADASPPDIFQLAIEIERGSGGPPETLLFPREPGEPLRFPVSAVILLPGGAVENYNLAITALDQSGNPIPEVPTVELSERIVVPPGDGETLEGELQVRRPQVDQYQHCDPDRVENDPNADCPAGLNCATVQGARANAFCTAQNCSRDIPGEDPGADPLCDDPAGGDGRCFDLGGFQLCLLVCETSADCPGGFACRVDLASQFGHGGCVSACNDDADCCAPDEPPCGFVCGKDAEGGRLCMAK